MTLKEQSGFSRERLLDEAEARFADKGFHAVSVREITGAAGCNLSSVNYHFGSKENLYLEVFRSRWMPRARRIAERFQKTLEESGSLSLASVVRALAQAFLQGPLSDDERRRHFQLMTREISQPSAAFELVAEEVMRPYFAVMANRIRPLLPEAVSPQQLTLNILAIFALVLHFNFARVAVTRITGREYDEEFTSQVVDHITRFSMQGLGASEWEDKG
jgi:AcrR family transcriptional regulator